MALKVSRIPVWAASIEDKPGGLAGKLGALAKAGANLEFIFARRATDRPGGGVVFLTPVRGATQIRAAKAAGFQSIARVHSVRVEGPDKPGLAAKVTAALGAAELNLRGFSGTGYGKNGVLFLAFDDADDAAKAIRLLKKL